MSSRVITPKGIEFIRSMAAAERYRDNRTAIDKCTQRDYASITAEDMRQVVFLTPAEWRRREQHALVVMSALVEREHQTIH